MKTKSNGPSSRGNTSSAAPSWKRTSHCRFASATKPFAVARIPRSISMGSLTPSPPPSPHPDHRVADVRPHFDDVLRRERANQNPLHLRHFGIGDGMVVLRSVLLDARQKRVARRREGVEVLGLGALEDLVDAGFHVRGS